MDVSISACKSEGEHSREKQETSPAFQTLKSLEEPQRRTEPADASNATKDVLVWWDIETCPIPSATSASNGATCLLQELQSHVNRDEIRVTINVYGNGGPGSKAGLDSLIANGITLRHRILPCKQPGSESAALKTMIVDIALWALSTPAPANVFLISTARDTSFRDLISGLHKRDYNIHLATKFNFGNETSPKDSDNAQNHLFNPMPRHWSVSKQLFVARTAPSRLQSPDDASPSPNAPLPEKLEQLQHLHLHS